MAAAKEHKRIFFVIPFVSGLVIVFAIMFYFYNNHIYARRVINAVEQGDVPKVQELMEYPFGNLNCKPTLWIYEVISETDEATPLQAACRAGNPEIVKLLIENGADVNYEHWDKSRSHGSPLLNAASSLSDNRLQIIQLLVENGADIDCVNIAGNDVLSCAVYASEGREDIEEIIEYLESKGLNIHKRYSDSQNTLLHKACEKDSFSVIQYLIEQKGFDVNTVNGNGDTALIYFLRFSSTREENTLLYLIQKGADLEAKNNDGKTAYDYATEKHPAFAELLK